MDKTLFLLNMNIWNIISCIFFFKEKKEKVMLTCTNTGDVAKVLHANHCEAIGEPMHLCTGPRTEGGAVHFCVCKRRARV